MSRIQALALESADTVTAATLQGVKAKIGMVPNLFTTLARSPAALNGYLALSEALSKGRLSDKQREIVALVSAQTHECQYCLSAHTLIGKGAGLSAEDIHQARAGKAATPHDQAVATLASQVLALKGRVADTDLEAARAAGLDEAQVLEVVVNVALNVLTNFTNNVAQTDIDFPVVDTAL